MEGGDWDLQAVVRGCGGGGGVAAAAAASRDPFFSFPPPLLVQDDDGGGVKDNDLLFCFPNLLGTETSLQELEQLYKPFLPQSSPPQPPPQQQKMVPLSLSSAGSPIPSPSSSSAVSLPNHTGGFTGARTQQPRQQQRQQQHQRSLSSQGTTATRSKRRKNQQKRVVCHVPADGLSSDMWAWRKYGQKPIKGSPYPRGYYRCSSSKGCLARKQVERCRTDPGVFVITYSAEHNHPVPTHRNSLAGSTRHKFTQTTSTSISSPTTTNTQHVNSSGGDNRVSPRSLSPTTPLTSSMEEELLLTDKKEGRGVEGEVEEDEDDEEGMLLVNDMEMLGEDDVLFLGLDDIHHPSSDDHFQTPFSASPWMANSNTTAAAGGD